jgi:DNA-3-methyladenine glycosylase II
MPSDARRTRSRHELSVLAPFRLDLTVSVLRRLSGNVVDVLTPEGQYVRALNGSRGPVVVRVMQFSPDALSVTVEGDEREHRHALELVRRILSVDRNLTHFNRAAARIPWLKPLAQRMRGVKPPRYPTLWEACVNAIVFQQISLQAASAILRRIVTTLGAPIEGESAPLYTFPSIASVQNAEDGVLRRAGLSLGKLTTLRRVGDALATGKLDEGMMEEYASPDAVALLRSIKGIGPWTAAVILLRGLVRLDVFPSHDTSVARNLALVAGAGRIDLEGTLRALSPQQGMLYYHLLLARLETRDDVGRASASSASSSTKEIE